MFSPINLMPASLMENQNALCVLLKQTPQSHTQHQGNSTTTLALSLSLLSSDNFSKCVFCAAKNSHKCDVQKSGECAANESSLHTQGAGSRASFNGATRSFSLSLLSLMSSDNFSKCFALQRTHTSNAKKVGNRLQTSFGQEVKFFLLSHSSNCCVFEMT